MTIDEKLHHFYESSVEEAKETASREIQEHKEKLQQMLESHKALCRQTADEALKSETDNARREINMALSAEQLTLKRNFTKKQTELKDQLFSEIRTRLKDFMATPQYEDYLCEKIKEAKDFAGGDELFIYLSSGDSGKIPALSQRTGLALLPSEEDFLGGIRATNPSKNILIDNSFAEKLQTMRKEFKFDGGLKHE